MTAEEFDQFYAASVKRLTGQVFAVTGDLSEAQDVVQEAYIRAWQHRRSLSMADAPEAWVRTVAVRLAISRWRRTRNAMTAWRARGESEHGGAPSPDHPALVAALRQIPEAQRVAIVLHHLCDLSVEQVAAEVGAPVGTVKTRLSRGRAALAPFLSEADLSEANNA